MVQQRGKLEAAELYAVHINDVTLLSAGRNNVIC